MNVPIPDIGKCYRLTDLNPGETTYIQIDRLFYDSCRHCDYEITKIQQIDNPFLLGCYQMKKEEFKIRYTFYFLLSFKKISFRTLKRDYKMKQRNCPLLDW